ncbi:filamentous hemagglutinin N-terminal domain-containing protein [Burkholderia orbicola]|nr:filamentous hemagglutinin N-terminal domain-containing protein [Burkholderia orbicola]MDN7533370.1 filamentous hemagglutinin N-terminal domain-containing protein [Burkholderia orbicola]
MLLAGARVVNGPDGVLLARNGNIALAAGGKVMLELNPDGSMDQAYVSTGASGASAANDGYVGAESGWVRLEGRAADVLSPEVVRNTGFIEAQSVRDLGGAKGSGTVTFVASGDTPESAGVRAGGMISTGKIAMESSGDLTLDGVRMITNPGDPRSTPDTVLKANRVVVSGNGATSNGTLNVVGTGEHAAYLQQGDLLLTNGALSASGFDRMVQTGGTLYAEGPIDLSAHDIVLRTVTTPGVLRATADHNLDVTGEMNANTASLNAGSDLSVSRAGKVDAISAGLHAGNDLNVDGRVKVSGAGLLSGKNVNIAGAVTTSDSAVGALRIGTTEGEGGALRINGLVDGMRVELYGDRSVEQSQDGILRGAKSLSVATDGRVALNGTVHAPAGYSVTEHDTVKYAPGYYAPGQAHGATASPVDPVKPGRGGSIVAGAGTISQDGKVTDVAQSTDRLVVNWKDFDIARDEAINFQQPNANAAVLNRVASGKVTSIDGALNANGRVFVLNPDGIVVGKNATINANGVTLAAADTSDDDFMQKRALRFNMDPAKRGIVQNEGAITTKTGAALIGRQATNLASGRITSGNGNVALAAGGGATMSLNADGSLNQIDVTQATDHALVANDGRITADNGYASLHAYASGAADAEIARNRGQIDAINRSNAARSASGLSKGDVLISGRNADNGDQGGIVNVRGRITGQTIRATSTGDLNVSNGATLNTRNVGPDYGVTLAGRRVTVASTGATINGDATVQGVGDDAVYVAEGPLNTSGKLSMSNIAKSR